MCNNVHFIAFRFRINIRWVGVKIRVRVRGVKLIPVWIRRYRYAIEEILTSANMIMTESDK